MHLANARTQTTAALVDLLLLTLKELSAAGRGEAACQLAGRACAILRQDDPKEWQKFNALLHRLSKNPAAGPIARN